MADGATLPPQRHLAAVARGVLLLRLAAAALSVPALSSSGGSEVGSFLSLLSVLAVSLVPLLAWRRVARHLTRHPIWLGLDLAVAVVFLSAAGAHAPFVIATTATAFLGGLLFGVPGAGVSAGLLVVGYGLAGAGQVAQGDGSDLRLLATFGTLYPLLAVAGVGLRRLLAELDAAHLAETSALAQVAATEERLRLARDLHDSVGKTLHGIALAARSLVTADPGALADRARLIEEGARTAGNEARALMLRLRASDTDEPLADALASLADELATGTGLTVRTRLDRHVDVPGTARHELVAAVGEGLENVRRHASASTVWLTVAREGEDVVVTVADDGSGFDATRAAAPDEHRCGMVGVRERLERLGGHAEWQSAADAGTLLRLAVPSGAALAGRARP